MLNRIKTVCKKFGDKTSIVDSFINKRVTYYELYNYSRQIAFILNNCNIKDGDFVVIMLDAGIDSYACKIACWMLGAIFIPLGEQFPSQRLKYINDICNVKFVIDKVFINHNIDLYTPMLDEDLFKDKKNEDDAFVIFTSGSTGTPKGILHNFGFAKAIIDRYIDVTKISSNYKHAVFASTEFIVSMQMDFAPLLVGAELHIIPVKNKKNIHYLNVFIDEFSINSIFVFPELAKLIAKNHDSLKFIAIAGDKACNIYFKNTSIYNFYGLSETAAFVSYKIDKSYENTPIGCSMSNEKVYILDKNNNKVDKGEICLAGYFLKKYINDKQLTSKRIVKNPFVNEDGYKWLFKTGDIGKYIDNKIYFIGRQDLMIKINGQRVEPVEVEKILLKHPKVNELVVFGIKDRHTQRNFLSAFYNSDVEISDYEFKKLLNKKVSSYMHPKFYIKVDSMPRNQNGKYNYEQLSKIANSLKYIKDDDYVKPVTKTEKIVCDAFSNVFHDKHIGINYDFLKHGGDSVTAIKLCAEINLGMITVADIINLLTPKRIAKLIDRYNDISLKSFKYNLDDGLPLNDSQMNVYIDQLANDKNIAYRTYFFYTCKKGRSLNSIYSALGAVIDSHPILRTKVMLKSNVPYLTWGKRPSINIVNKVSDIDLNVNIDIFNGPLTYIYICKIKNNYVIACIMSHLISDGKSDEVFSKFLNDAFNYKSLEYDMEFVKDINIKINCKEKFTKNSSYEVFDKMFSRIESVPKIPFEETSKNSYRTFNIDLSQEKVNALVRKYKITEAVFFECCYALTLSCFTGSRDSVFCITDNGRDLINSNLAIGMFVKNIPIALKIDDITVEHFVKRSFKQIIKARSCKNLDFAKINKKYAVDSSYIFQYFSDFLKFEKLFDASEEVINNVSTVRESIADIDCYLYKYKNSYKMKVTYSYRYSNNIIRSFVKTFNLVANELLIKKYISDIEYADANEIKTLDKYNYTSKNLKYNDIIEAYNHCISFSTDNLALTYDNKRFNYRELDSLVINVCKILQQNEVSSEDIVAVHVETSEWMLICVLAILRLGAAYVPINIDYPYDWKNKIIKLSKAKCCLCTSNNCIKNNNCIIIDKLNNQPISNNISFPKKYNLYQTATIIFTSGSTGTPKGVALTRRGIANLCEWQSNFIHMKTTDVFGMYQNFSFVSHIDALLSFLWNGASVDIVPDNVKLDMNLLNKHFNSHNVSLLKMGASIGREFFKEVKNTNIRAVFLGGEKLGEMSQVHECKIIDGYGPTENTSQTSAIYIEDKMTYDSIGFPIYNQKTYVLNCFGKRLPRYGVGINYASGYGVSLGYINNQSLNKKVFTKNQFETDKDYKIKYKIGDLTRYIEDGSMAYLGRADNQVQINGCRVELSEVDICIRRCSIVKAVCCAVKNINNNNELVAYVVLKEKLDNEKLTSLIKNFVKKRKPIYMVPTYVVALEKLPLTKNSKVDKNKLFVPKLDTLRANIILPRNKLENELYKSYKKVLNCNNFGIDDNFINLGGDSLKAIQCAFNIKDYKILASDILTYKTIRNISQHVFDNNAKTINFDKYNNKNIIPLSQSQLAMYLDIKVNDKASAYILFSAIKIDKSFSLENIKDALNNVYKAHPILSSKIVNKDSVVCMEITNFNPEICVYKKYNTEDIYAYLNDICIDGKSLSKHILVKDNNNWTLYSSFSHIIFDGFSNIAFKSDFQKALNNRELNLDFACHRLSAFDNQIRKTDLYKNAKKYFMQKLDLLENTIPFKSIDYEVSTGNYFKKIKLTKYKVNKFCSKKEITVASFFNAVFALTLSEFTFSDIVQYMTTNNFREFINVENGIGCIAQATPVIINCSHLYTDEFLYNANKSFYESMKYSYFPIRDLIKKYDLETEIEYQFMPMGYANFLSLSKDNIGFKNFNKSYTYYDNRQVSVDFLCYICETSKGYCIDITHSKRFNKTIIMSFAETFCKIAQQLIDGKNLNTLNIVPKRTLSIMNMNNITYKQLNHDSCIEAFNNSLVKYPNNVLVRYYQDSYTYSYASQFINTLVKLIHNIIVGRSHKIAVLVNRGCNYVLCALSILSSDNIYVPIDNSYPDKRIKFIVDDSKSDLIITDNYCINKIPNGNYKIINIDKLDKTINNNYKKINQPKVSDNDIACILYTSGTTGVPKGVLVRHKSIINLSEWFVDNTNLNHHDIFCLYASFSFDVHIEVFYSTIFAGGTIDIVSFNDRLSVDTFGSYLDSHKITFADLPSAFLKIFVELYNPKTLKVLFAGGESLGRVNPIGNYTLYDSYGPTEATVIETAIVNNNKICSSSIGHLLSNTKSYILDSKLNRLPFGAIGELYLSGIQIASGYLNRDKETKTSFIRNPFDGKHKNYEYMYKTGDLVAYLPDGTLSFQGRRDSQVKIRGNRVELNEIETIIRAISFIKDTTVQVYRKEKENELVAYVVLDDNKKYKYEDVCNIINDYIKKDKPEYMCPSYINIIGQIPLTANGKINKRLLPEPERKIIKKFYIAPKNDIQLKICNCFSKVLEIDRISINDDFFELGGTSLSAVILLAELKNKNFDIVYKDLFDNPTPKKLAESLDVNLQPQVAKINKTAENYNYSSINKLISFNDINNISLSNNNNLGSILLTGATGFLGIHVLNHYLKYYKGNAYLLIRADKKKSIETKLNRISNYYFNKSFFNLFKDRLICIEGSIQDPAICKKLFGLKANTLINCAAIVKHFTNNEEIYNTNYLGVKNLVEICRQNKMNLIQISTVSVAGIGSKKMAQNAMTEKQLYFGQSIDNDYIKTKFLAERYVLQAIADKKITGKIIRMGNLMSRYQDAMFQKNYHENGFLRNYLPFLYLGYYPESILNKYIEFSPVDYAAEAVLKIANNNSNFSICHAFNNNKITNKELVHALSNCGYNLIKLSDDEFMRIVSSCSKKNMKTDILLGIYAYEQKNKDNLYLKCDSKFSVKYLKSINFQWPVISQDYLIRLINYLKRKSFFE